MAVAPFMNRYCPICLMQVDVNSGNHWNYCEYEASLGSWINPQQPLTELEMLKAKLRNTEKELTEINHHRGLLKQRIISLQSDIKEKSGN